ncbi:hypothetical protein [Corynebacterium sp. UMB2355A]|uniref:hypothetical protein n=1 Tax=Corynebacterium sp. UMB2355A TaxID=3081222 RepID=UPI0029FF5643|nr:hypothetical protein [Corynebacterium sp. UMB2355A]WPJ93745.1 hypothetical protein R0V12_05265 [Corynebacterium sp. UMB2355A]
MTLFGLLMGAATIFADWLGSVPLVITAATFSSLLLYATFIPESDVFRSYGMNRKRALAYKRRAALVVWAVLCIPTLIVSPSLYGLLAIALVTGWLALYVANDSTTGEELNSSDNGSAIMGLRLDQPLIFQLFWKQPLLLAVAFGLGSVAVQFAVRSFADKTWIPSSQPSLTFSFSVASRLSILGAQARRRRPERTAFPVARGLCMNWVQRRWPRGSTLRCVPFLHFSTPTPCPPCPSGQRSS